MRVDETCRRSCPKPHRRHGSRSGKSALQIHDIGEYGSRARPAAGALAVEKMLDPVLVDQDEAILFVSSAGERMSTREFLDSNLGAHRAVRRQTISTDLLEDAAASERLSKRLRSDVAQGLLGNPRRRHDQA